MPPLSPADFVRGALDAPVVLVHYGDFECPYSGALHPVLRQLETHLGDQIAVVFRPFPLFDIHPHALQAALAAKAAADKFWAMHDILFENQDKLSDGDLRDYAQQIGLDAAKFRADFASPDTREAMENSIKSAKNVGIHGTPTLFINGQFHDNREGLWQMKRLLPLFEKILQNA
ncbi:DsbA family protein [Abditibacterium utsteinense]|nr:thioredoxin domain-containing protein [Abditibacterium utsteinense]